MILHDNGNPLHDLEDPSRAANRGTAELPAATHTAAVHSKATSFNDPGNAQDGEEGTCSPTMKRRRIGDKHARAGTGSQAFLPARERGKRYRNKLENSNLKLTNSVSRNEVYVLECPSF
jgi:hypothetical protein